MNTDIVAQPQLKPRFLKCEEILPSRYYKALSPNARRIYQTAWNRLNGYGSDTLWIRDALMVERTRIRPEQLGPAQSELSRAGLVEMVPGLIQTRYRILDPDAEVTEPQD